MEINKVSGVRSDISEMLSKIREVSNNTKVFSENHAVASTNNFNDVMSVVKSSLDSVNEVQIKSENLKTAYVSGDTSVSMSQVVLAAQQSKLAFEGLISVRNKILDAYKEIMAMPV